MKNRSISLALLGLTLITSSVKAQDWEEVGKKVTPSNTSEFDFTVANNGTVYVAYSDLNSGGNIGVKQFDGKEWTNTGANKYFSLGPASMITMATDNNSVPYVVYSDARKSYKARVEKFNGKEWEMVGAELTTGGINGSSLVFSKANVPYLAITDNNLSKVFVKKWNNNAWENVGAEVFDERTPFISLSIDNNDVLYIVYADSKIGNKAVVKKYDGKNWVLMGTTVSPKSAKFINLKLDNTNTPWVSYLDDFNNNKVVLAKWEKNAWVEKGTPVYKPGFNEYVASIIVNTTPYMFLSDTHDYNIISKKLNGTAWAPAGSTENAGKGRMNKVLLYKGTHTVYLAFKDEDNAMSVSIKKLTVQ